MEADANTLIALSFHKQENGKFSEIELFGPNCEFCVGLRLLGNLGITQGTDWRIANDALVRRFQYSQYGRGSDCKRTTTNMQIETRNGKEMLTYYTKNNFDMISYAKIIILAYDIKDFSSAVMMYYEDFMKVVPSEWELIDNFQYFTTELSDKEFDDLLERAKPYNLMGKNI